MKNRIINLDGTLHLFSGRTLNKEEIEITVKKELGNIPYSYEIFECRSAERPRTNKVKYFKYHISC